MTRITLANLKQFVKGVICVEYLTDISLTKPPVNHLLNRSFLYIISSKHVFDSLDLFFDNSGLNDSVVVVALVLGLVVLSLEVVDDHLSVDVVGVGFVLVDLVLFAGKCLDLGGEALDTAEELAPEVGEEGGYQAGDDVETEDDHEDDQVDDDVGLGESGSGDVGVGADLVEVDGAGEGGGELEVAAGDGEDLGVGEHVEAEGHVEEGGDLHDVAGYLGELDAVAGRRAVHAQDYK